MSMSSDSSKPRCVADALGLGSLADADQGLDPEVLRAIYRHARNQDGTRVLFEKNSTFAKGWINLDSGSARALVASLIDLDDEDELKKARKRAKMNLQAAPWNDVLGIEDPPIKCLIKIHGIYWGLRFQSATPTKRGNEVINEMLPAIPGAAAPNPEPRTADAAPPTPTQPAAPATPDSAAEVLQKGGLL